MSIPEHMHVSEGPQRFDVFTGGLGGRRRFTAGEKAAIVDGSCDRLGWSMNDLARAAHPSASTVKRVETAGLRSVSESAHDTVQAALQAAGVRFLDDTGEGPGLRLQPR